MSKDIIHRLPAYPSAQARKSFSATQLASLNQAIYSTLLKVNALPSSKLDSVQTFPFVSSYAKDRAAQDLERLIWNNNELSNEDRHIRKQTLLLAERIASSTPGFELNNLLDLSIVYAPTNISRIKSVFDAALNLNPGIVQVVSDDLVPALTQLLNPSRGLYAIRKTSHCIISFLSASPPEIVRCFAYDKDFILSLATLYDSGLTSVARSYGGLLTLREHDFSTADDWESIWVQTKVDIIDAFHAIISILLDDLSSSSEESLAAELERTFEIIFSLLEIPSSSNTSSTMPTPFLDRPLLSDYQDSYSLSKTLASALRHAAEKDARLDLLESSLQSLESPSTQGDPGVLKILIRSSGMPLVRSTSSRNGSSSILDKGKGKAREPSPPTSRIPDIDLKVTQVLDILPDHPPDYVRSLLEHHTYGGNPEKVVEALLEGTAPSAEGLRSQANNDEGLLEYIHDRKNVFDNEVMDLSRVRVGKKRDDASTLLKDRSSVARMKADILRRVEEMDNDEDGDGDEQSDRKDQGVIVAFDDEEALVAAVKIEGDGEESEQEAESEEPPKLPNPETILELAYIRDPKLFDRDAQTRRSKARSDLKSQTRWGDEQIEGWKIMLERNPRKDRILQKHEFAGNRNIATGDMGALSLSGSHAGTGDEDAVSRGGGGRGRGRGRGRGGGRGGGAEHSDSARGRAWKDKNKASRGNHNRKRGHDKKVARAGPAPA